MGGGLRRGEGQTRVGAFAAIVVAGPGNALAFGVVDPAQQRIVQRAAAARGSLQVDPVGLARLQLDREPVAVAPGLDLAGGRTADRDPSRRAGIVREIVDIGDRQRVGAGAVSIAARRNIVGGGVGGGEPHAPVRTLAAVVVPGAVDEDSVRVVEPVQGRIPQRAVAARGSLKIDPVGLARLQLDREPVAVAPGLDLAGGGAADRDPSRGAGVGRKVVRDLDDRQRVGAGVVGGRVDVIAGRGRIVGGGLGRGEKHLAVRALAAVVVKIAADFVAARVEDCVQGRMRQRTVAGRRALQIDPVGLACFQLDREPVAVVHGLDLADGGAAHRDPSRRARIAREIVRGSGCRDRSGRAGVARRVLRILRNLGDRQRVGAGMVRAREDVIANRRHMVGGGVGRRERQPAALALAAVMDRGGVDEDSVRIVDAVQDRIPQRAVAGRRALQIDPVGLARFELDREPVVVEPGLDLAGGGTADRDPSGRVGILREIVHIGDRQRVGAGVVGVRVDVIASRRHIVDGGLGRRERHPAVRAHAAVMVRNAGNEVSARIVDPMQARMRQRAVAGRRPLQVDPVAPARLQLDREPVVVAQGLELAGGGATDRNAAGGAGIGREVVAGLGDRKRVGARAVGARVDVIARRTHIVGGGIGRREQHPAVRAHAAVVVPNARDEVSVRIEESVQVRTRQRAVAGRCALQIDPVGLARFELDRNPVAVARGLDLAGDGAIDQDPSLRRCVGGKILSFRLRSACRLARLLRLGLRFRVRRRLRLCRLVAQVVCVRTFLHRHHPHIVGPGLKRRLDPLVPDAVAHAPMQHVAVLVLQEEVGVGVLAPQGERHLPRLAQREAVVVRRVGPAVDRIPVGPRPIQRREVAEVGGAVRRRVGVGLRHPHRVGAGLPALAARSDVVGSALGRGEGQPGVGALAAIVVAGPGDALALGVVEPAQQRIAQRAAPARRPLEVDDVGLSRHQLDGKPVDVSTRLDDAGGAAADRDGAGSLCVGLEVVSHERLLQPVGQRSSDIPRAATTESTRCTARRDRRAARVRRRAASPGSRAAGVRTGYRGRAPRRRAEAAGVAARAPATVAQSRRGTLGEIRSAGVHGDEPALRRPIAAGRPRTPVKPTSAQTGGAPNRRGLHPCPN